MKKSWIKKGIVGIIMLAIFLAPVSTGVEINDKGNLAVNIEKNEALATSVTDYFGTSSIQVESTTSNSVKISGKIQITSGNATKPNGQNEYDAYSYIGGSTVGDGIFLVIREKNNTTPVMEKSFSVLNLAILKSYTINNFTWTSGTDKVALKENTDYTVQLVINANTKWTGFSRYDPWKSSEIPFTTLKYNENDKGNTTSTGSTNSQGIDQDLSLGCTNLMSFSLSGCVAQLSYVVWSVSALVVRAAGTFLDFLVYYSTNDSSYRNEFINQGWGAVRDIANIFFIIALLYVAIKTILGLNVTDNKKLVGAVIVIALIINFSLFTTKVVIDASNILAKVFYNNITSKDAVAKNADETPKDVVGDGGEKAISVGLVQKFNPQNLVTQPQYDASPWTYIFMTVLLTGLMLYMSYIFFSVGLLFVARVVSLWIAMIFSPIAFVSYAVPFEIPGFGHKEWWKNLLENALLAPIFIFFLYIIILFADFLNSIMNGAYGVDNTNLTSMENLMQHVMATLIPFVILFVLLKKAKELAVKYSGEMGEGIVKAGAVLGGLAVGGAALGVAAAGRGTVGAVSKYVQNDTARDKAFTFKETRDKWNTMNKVNPFAYLGLAGKAITGVAKFIPAGIATGMHGGRNLNAAGQVQPGGVGKWMQKQDTGFGLKTHATSLLDQKAKSEFGHLPGYENVKYKDLKETEQKDVKKQVDLDAMAKFKYGKQFKDLEAPEAMEVKNRYETSHERPIAGPDGKITSVGVVGVGDKIMSDAFVEQSKAKVAIGEFVQALRKGSYDIRNLPDMSAKSKGFGPKFAVGLIATVAAGMRLGIKKGTGVEHYGTPQKDFLKDIGNTVSEALKNAKISIGGGKEEKDHTKEVKSVGH